jgi:hypothetical protein
MTDAIDGFLALKGLEAHIRELARSEALQAIAEERMAIAEPIAELPVIEVTAEPEVPAAEEIAAEITEDIEEIVAEAVEEAVSDAIEEIAAEIEPEPEIEPESEPEIAPTSDQPSPEAENVEQESEAPNRAHPLHRDVAGIFRGGDE